jgi:hypothetical protein
MTEPEVLSFHTESFYGALKRLDLAMLDEIYSDRYMLVRPDGSVLNKQQVLKDLEDRRLTFQSIEIRQAQVRLLGSVAILSGESTTVSSRDGNETRSQFRLVAVYVEEDTVIKLMHFQSTYLKD